MPTASIRPMSEIRLMETVDPAPWRSRYMKVKVQMIEMGIARLMIKVLRTFRRKRNSTMTASMPPSSPVFRRSESRSRMLCDWSKKTRVSRSANWGCV